MAQTSLFSLLSFHSSLSTPSVRGFQNARTFPYTVCSTSFFFKVVGFFFKLPSDSASPIFLYLSQEVPFMPMQAFLINSPLGGEERGGGGERGRNYHHQKLQNPGLFCPGGEEGGGGSSSAHTHTHARRQLIQEN